jgi:NADH-quinone oxidoreductase subunit F
VRQEEALSRLARNGDGTREAALLEELAQVMRDASICGLGQTAANAIVSALSKGLLRTGTETR